MHCLKKHWLVILLINHFFGLVALEGANKINKPPLFQMNLTKNQQLGNCSKFGAKSLPFGA